jgi:hypothetical protein
MGRVIVLGVLGVVCLAAGCGDGASPFASFIGTWQAQAGSQIQAVCPQPVGNVNTDVRGNLEVLPAIDADLVTLDPNGCDPLFKVTGNVATATGNLSCSHPGQMMGVTQENQYTSLTLTTVDGKTMMQAAMGNVTFRSAAGTLSCTFTANATWKKVSNE